METAPGTMVEADAALTSPAEPTAEPVGEPAGQARDEQGRFTSPPTPEPEASPPEEPAEAEPTGEPAPTEEPAPAVEESESSAEEYAEFGYRADNQDFTIPGSAVGDDGVFIPADHVPELQNLLSAGKAAFGSVRQRLSESASREQSALKRAEAAEAQSQHVLSYIESLIEQGRIGDWLQQVQTNWPVLKAEAKAKGLELQAQAERDELAKYREQERTAQLRPVMDQTLEQSVLRFGTTAGLDERGMAEVYRMLREPRYESLVFVKAPYDDPAGGIRKGDLVIDYGVVEGAVRLAASGRVQQTKVQQAQAQNRLVPKKIPPTVGGKGAKAPKPGPVVPKFASREEADQWFANGGFNELDFDEAE